MSEHAAVRNESHQETFWSSLNDSFNFSFYNYICLGSLVLFWQILLKVSTNWNVLHHGGRQNGTHRYGIKRHIFSPLITILICNKLLERPNSPVVKCDVKKKQQETHHIAMPAIVAAKTNVTPCYDSGKTPLDYDMLCQVSLVYPSVYYKFLTLTRFIFSTISLILRAL